MSELPNPDFNLPPGVRAIDIPGNRPEDDYIECFRCRESIPLSAFDDDDEVIDCPICNMPVSLWP